MKNVEIRLFLNNWYNNILKTEIELAAINTDLTKTKPAPKKWSPNEILGHLVDSAINNYRRFILMQLQDNLVFDVYNQNKWVELQSYISKDWKDILNTWTILNVNIIKLLEEIGLPSWDRQFKDHSLDKTAWRSVPKSQPATMGYLVKDYFGHMVHHLKQIYFLAQMDNSIGGWFEVG